MTFVRFETFYPLMTLLTIAAMCSATMDVVVDGLMVIQSRADPQNGSEDLQTYSWIM
eukprot:CAMPEP_0116871082 /NCGR_PEP_ID=MMETSP0463-20121206/1297_1 /TAXON_ID=181622 /ORGANISM="Strombidinopsis sp, Strain SopsisLIS2011" /LENGTH=56 /DNA_ID=CAMNT_0004508877 /DNA_START=410 /DNA_END=580 /DNA_ORIENTATION=+